MCKLCTNASEYMRRHPYSYGWEQNVQWGRGRSYSVTLDSDGFEFTEIVEYPSASHGPDGCVSEGEREARAVVQAKRKFPTWRNIRALRSISC